MLLSQSGMLKDLTQLTLATAIAGATAIAVVAVPLYWHTPRPESATRTLNWLWPDTPLLTPSEPDVKPPNTIAEIAISEARRVKLETFSTISTAPPPQVTTSVTETREPEGRGSYSPAPEVPKRDICQRDGGWKVTTHRGRSWHCVYPERATRAHYRKHRRRS
jgi:hypothetical protein